MNPFRRRKYSYSDPFLVTTTYLYAGYYQWQRDDDTGKFKLKSCSFTTVYVGSVSHQAPDALSCFPPLVHEAP